MTAAVHRFFLLGGVLLALGSCEKEVHLGQADAGLVGALIAAGGEQGPTSSGGAGGETGGASSSPEICTSEALFCSGFEASLQDDWESVQVNGPGAVLEVAQSPVRTGMGALHSSVGGGAENARAQWVFDQPVTSGLLVGRAFFYVSSASSFANPVIGMEFNDPNSGGTNKTSVNFDVENSLRLVTTTGLDASGASSEVGVFETDVWNCLLLTVDVSPQGSIVVSLNGDQVIMVEGNTVPPDGFNRFLLGALGDPNDVGFEIYWDDAEVARQPLGCPN